VPRHRLCRGGRGGWSEVGGGGWRWVEVGGGWSEVGGGWWLCNISRKQSCVLGRVVLVFALHYRMSNAERWSMFGTARGFKWRPFKGCKYDTTYIFTNAIMFGASAIFILSNLLPVFGYAIWFRKRPAHMSDCVRTLCPLAAKYLKIVSS